MKEKPEKTKPPRSDITERCLPIRLLYKTCVSLKHYGVRHTAQSVRWTLRKAFGYAVCGKYGLYSKRELREQAQTVFSEKVTFSIIVPLYNTPKKFLREMIGSVQAQTYPHWELCLADGSDAAHGGVEAICRRFAEKDGRIRYRKLNANLGISGNSNAALELAQGAYIALLDHDDLLHPAALFAVMREISAKGADFLYTDEGVFRHGLRYCCLPHFKPDYAPDTLRGNNYICHLTVFRRTLLEKTGGFRSEYDGSQDYDLILRLTEQAERIVHVPELLYYWRAHAGSVAKKLSAKPYAAAAGVRALSAHLARIGSGGEVSQTESSTIYRIRYRLMGQPLVSVIIPNRDHTQELKRCLDSVLEKTAYPNFEVILVENGSTEPETPAYYEKLKADARIRVAKWEGGFNYSAINNFGVGFAKGEYLLLLNNDTEIITPQWIEELLMFAQRSDVGAVGAMLYYPNDSIQHAGVFIGYPGLAEHYHKTWARSSSGYMGRLYYAQNVSAVTGACMMIPKRVWEQVGGLDERFAVAYNDVDLCLRIRRAGYLVVWTPFAELYHLESVSRGYEDTPEKLARFHAEADLLRSRWEKELKKGDPYFNPNFVPERSDFIYDWIKNAKKRIRAREAGE